MSVEILQGARRHFGPRTSEVKVPSKTNTSGNVEELVIDFDYANLNSASAVDALVLDIPKDSLIKSSTLFVSTAFAGGTSLELGSEADPDGLDSVLLAALVEDAVIVNDGVLVGAAWDAADSTVVLSATGTFTAGVGRLVVEYVPPVK